MNNLGSDISHLAKCINSLKTCFVDEFVADCEFLYKNLEKALGE